MTEDLTKEELLNTPSNALGQDPCGVAPEDVDVEIFVKMQCPYISSMEAQKLEIFGLMPLKDTVQLIRLLFSAHRRSPSRQKRRGIATT